MIRLFNNSLRPGPLADFWYKLIEPKTASGVQITESVAQTYSVVWAATRLLCSSGSCLPLNLFENKSGLRVIRNDHPVQRLIHDEPNPEMSSMMWRSYGIQQQVNAGMFFSEIDRSRPGRVQLWPIHTSRVKPVRLDDEAAMSLQVTSGSLAWEVQNTNAEPSIIPDRDMFRVSSMMTDNGIVGKGVVTQARESIGFGIATERQGSAYMANSARPTVVIIGGKFRSGEDREEYRRQWMETHGGAENNAKPALIPEGGDIKTLSFSPEDSQFLQTRQHNVEEVARWYGVPPHMIGHLLRSTFNNIETQSIEFVVYSLIPWLKLWEEEIKRKLLTEEEKRSMYAKHNVEGLLRGDATSRAEFYAKMWELGVFSTNEIRDKEDMNPIGPEGDQRFAPMNFQTLSQVEQNASDSNGTTDQMSAVHEQFREWFEEETLEVQGSIQRIVDGTIATQRRDHSDINVRESLVARTTQKMLSDTWSRMVSKERTAICRLAKKQPSEFFAGLDDLYAKHQEVAEDAIREPLETWLLATKQTLLPDELVTKFVGSSLERHKEEVLLETEINEEQWPELGERLSSLASSWVPSDLSVLLERELECQPT